ncbi:MAG: SRPBCC family protein [Methylococcales bacterium]|nr:SRPBCC family protein [Methylococcales bacterium]
MKNYFALLMFLFSSFAYAHGPVRQDTDETITINAPADKVWGIIKNFGDMSWLPPVKSTDVKGGNEKGAVRVLTLQDGGSITEEMKKYDEAKMSYSYKITDMSTAKTITHAGKEEKVPVVPVDNYSATITVEAQGATSSVRWKAGYYRAYTNNEPPEDMNEAAANAAIKGIFTTGLNNLKALAEK